MPKTTIINGSIIMQAKKPRPFANDPDLNRDVARLGFGRPYFVGSIGQPYATPITSLERKVLAGLRDLPLGVR